MQHSQGHGSKTTSSSRSSTSLAESGTSTPAQNMDAENDLWKDGEITAAVTEKLQRKESFQKARIFLAPSSNVRSTGLTKEHQEQGSVKIEVYKQYIYAASKVGFILYLLTIAGQQATSVLGTLTLRYWGEHNQELGNNSSMFKYLLVYGLFSLSSSILGGVAAIIMWVYCALRSARHLHDSVRGHNYYFFWEQDLNLQCLDARISYARSTKLFRTNTHWSVSCFDLFLFLILYYLSCLQNSKPLLTRHVRG